MVSKAHQWLGSVASLTPLSPRMIKLILTISGENPLWFRAGQYALLSRPGGLSYAYSFATPPVEEAGNHRKNQVEFHIARGQPTHDGEFLNQLAMGDPIIINGPFGHAYYRDHHHGPALGLAGGSGLGPIKCIAEQALSNPSHQPFYLYHGARKPEDLYLDHHLRLLSDRHTHFHYVATLSDVSSLDPLSQYSAAPNWRMGTVCDCVATDFKDLSNWKAYIAGPSGMIETACQLLQERGLDDENMHSDALQNH